VLPYFATPFLNAVQLLTGKDNLVFNPIFKLLSLRAIQKTSRLSLVALELITVKIYSIAKSGNSVGASFYKTGKLDCRLKQFKLLLLWRNSVRKQQLLSSLNKANFLSLAKLTFFEKVGYAQLISYFRNCTWTYSYLFHQLLYYRSFKLLLFLYLFAHSIAEYF